MGSWELIIRKYNDIGKCAIVDIRDLSNDEIGKIIDQIRERNSDGDLEDD